MTAMRDEFRRDMAAMDERFGREMVALREEFQRNLAAMEEGFREEIRVSIRESETRIVKTIVNHRHQVLEGPPVFTEPL